MLIFATLTNVFTQNNLSTSVQAVAKGVIGHAVVIDDGDEARVIFTRRTATLRKHSGQVSFPGGAIDPQALAGSAYTSLGSLYYQVPGWPIGFGDDEKAEKMLTQALAINPDGLDPNYFYGDFLQRQKRYEEARAALEKALAAKDRPGRELADNGRRAEATALLQQVESKLQ